MQPVKRRQGLVTTMSNIETNQIKIELSGEWSLFEENKQLVVHGPDNTEIIVSRSVLTGKGSESDKKGARDLVKLRFAEFIRRNASQDELTTTVELSERVLASGIELTELSSV